MFQLRVEMSFDYAHRLLTKDGKEFYDKKKCGSLHGHRGVAIVTLRSIGTNKFGFVKDFSDIKTDIKQWIDKNWDHATIIHPHDQNLLNFIRDEGDRFYMMPEGLTTSAESMARRLYEIIKEIFKYDVLSVEIYETPTSSALYKE